MNMITRYKIMQGVTEIMDLGAHEAFKLGDTDYPADWIERNGTIPGHTVESYDATPPPPPPPEPTATGAQMVDEAESRGKLDMLTAALTPSEMAIFVTRRRIVAGSNFAEVLRSKLSVTVAQMASFIAAAAVRSEV